MRFRVLPLSPRTLMGKALKAVRPTRVSSTAADNERHGNYLPDNTNRLLDKLLVDGSTAAPYA